MGNWILPLRPPDTTTMGAPAFRSPFTDMMSHVGHQDGNDECLPFELRWIDCCEAYGREMARTKCRDLYQDHAECATQWKQRARMGDMMERRYQLWFQGIRGVGPKRGLFHETPRYDGYVPNFLYDDSNWRSL